MRGHRLSGKVSDIFHTAQITALVRNDVNFKLSHVSADDEGRYVIIEAEVKGLRFCLWIFTLRMVSKSNAAFTIIYIYIYTYIQTHTHTHTHTHIHIYTHTYIYIYICIKEEEEEEACYSRNVENTRLRLVFSTVPSCSQNARRVLSQCNTRLIYIFIKNWTTDIRFPAFSLARRTQVISSYTCTTKYGQRKHQRKLDKNFPSKLAVI